MSNEVQLLEPKLQRFVHLYLTGQYNQTQLAQLLEVHKNTINSWLKREDVNIAIKIDAQGIDDLFPFCDFLDFIQQNVNAASGLRGSLRDGFIKSAKIF